MKIGIWLPNFNVFELNKCYGQITLGLSELGHEVCLITSGEGRIVGEESEKIKTLTKISLSNASDVFSQYDLVIMYTWLSKSFVSWVEEAAKSGTDVIIKSDHVGRIGTKASLVHERSKYLISNFWKPRLLYASAKQLVKISAIYSKTMRKIIFNRLIKQIELSKKVLIESPHAAYNLSAALGHLGRYDLIEKIVVVPNPAAPVFTRNTPQKFDKENIIVSVARWNDEAKNPKNLMKALINFLRMNKNWKAILIGPGENVLRKYLEKFDPKKQVHSRIQILGRMPNSEIRQYVLKSKIYLSASRWEGFSIALAEALCLGATAVGPRLESLEYLTHLGFSGTLAISHRWDDLLAALIREAILWEKGIRNPEEISKFWSNIFDRKNIAQKILDSLNH